MMHDDRRARLRPRLRLLADDVFQFQYGTIGTVLDISEKRWACRVYIRKVVRMRACCTVRKFHI